MAIKTKVLLGLVVGLGFLAGCSSSSDTHSDGFYPDYVKLKENPISSEDVLVYDWRSASGQLPKGMRYNVLTSPELSTGNEINTAVLEQSKAQVEQILRSKIPTQQNQDQLTVEIAYLGVAGHHFGFRDILPVVLVIDAAKKAATDEVLQVALAAKLQTPSGEVIWGASTQTSGEEPADKDNVTYAELKPLIDKAVDALAEAYVQP